MYIFDVAARERLISMAATRAPREVRSHFQYGDATSDEGPPKLVTFDDPDLQRVPGRSVSAELG